MPTPIEIVTNFLAQWSKGRAAMHQSYRDYFTAETDWQNVGLTATKGIDKALALMEGFEANYGIQTIAVDMLNIAAVGNTVLTERIDRMLHADGTEVMALRLMGVFEIAEGKIERWYDYFDTAAVPPPRAA
jgi:limonene-1,2-epoxide hydrolase